MSKIVVFLGLFDFIIIGYFDLVEWVLFFFDEIVVVIGVNF